RQSCSCLNKCQRRTAQRRRCAAIAKLFSTMTQGAQNEFSFGKFNTIRTLKEMITRSTKPPRRRVTALTAILQGNIAMANSCAFGGDHENLVGNGQGRSEFDGTLYRSTGRTRTVSGDYRRAEPGWRWRVHSRNDASDCCCRLSRNRAAILSS